MNAETKIEVPTGLALLRAEFPPHQISKLPKETGAQAKQRKADQDAGKWPPKCGICQGYHHPKAVHLDYVGHAALTDRLLDCDPEWTWEPMGTTPEGLPVIAGGLWIKLTVCGVSRYGFGDADGKSGGNAIKEMIGDAIRNAAMRFGAALELWHKGDLHVEDDDGNAASRPTPRADPVDAPVAMADGEQIALIDALSKAAKVPVQKVLERAGVDALPKMTRETAQAAIDGLNAVLAKRAATQPQPAAPAPAHDILDDEIPY